MSKRKFAPEQFKDQRYELAQEIISYKKREILAVHIAEKRHQEETTFKPFIVLPGYIVSYNKKTNTYNVSPISNENEKKELTDIVSKIFDNKTIIFWN
ncbi:MAG: hypothetical protein AABX73_03740 [Nanoarchaeota archaeon]